MTHATSSPFYVSDSFQAQAQTNPAQQLGQPLYISISIHSTLQSQSVDRVHSTFDLYLFVHCYNVLYLCIEY